MIIGFDGMEATLVERWAADGTLPTFARLARETTRLELETCLDTFPDGIWLELTTGRLAGKLGTYWHPRQVHAGEARQRAVSPTDIAAVPWWAALGGEGRSAVAFDVPRMVPIPGFEGLQVAEWGTHERSGPPMAEPATAIDRLLARYKEHPVRHDVDTLSRCDDHDGSERALLQLRDRLLAGAEVRGALVADLLAEHDWDLFLAVFTEAHCAGHQLWHAHDERSPWHHEAPPSMHDTLKRVYREVDAGVGRIVEAAPTDAVVFLLFSHGMAVNRGGWQLLPEVLVRLGHGSGQGSAARVRGRLPEPVKRALRTAVRGRARTRLQAAAGSLQEPLESPRTRAMATMNGRCGAVRINLQRRDPFGAVTPGAEYDELCAELARDLEELVEVRTRARAVKEVVRADAVYGDDLHPNMPDLIVRWNPDLLVVEAVTSARTGTVSRPVRSMTMPRTGDHSTQSALWMRGARLAAGPPVPVRAVDLAPSALQILGVEPLPDLDGRPLALQLAARI